MMAHSKEAHAQMDGRGKFKMGHWEKPVEDTMVGDGKYSSGEMNQMEDYKKSVDGLAGYAKRHKEKH
jgi:hypothetical protein